MYKRQGLGRAKGLLGALHLLCALGIGQQFRAGSLAVQAVDFPDVYKRQQMAMAANNAAGAAITQRTSIAQPDGNGMQSVSLNKADGVNKKGAALWIMPLYQGQNAWGMEAGNFDLKWHGGLGGVALGGDYTFDLSLIHI